VGWIGLGGVSLLTEPRPVQFTEVPQDRPAAKRGKRETNIRMDKIIRAERQPIRVNS
jgi:hypothetical protein